jgi:uncharacterized membrane protein
MILAKPEPRWPALLALLSVGGLHYALPDSLSIGPDWLLLAVVCALLVPTVVSHRAGNHRLNHIFGLILLGVVTLFLAFSLVQLIAALPSKTESPQMLLRSAGLVWVTNILVFACWYWRLDAGGPHARHQKGHLQEGAFLFPQMTIEGKKWQPGFVDYLFVAFNTSTAFSPTDAPVLSRWAKGMMMVQSTISFTTVALLAARAVNIL